MKTQQGNPEPLAKTFNIDSSISICDLISDLGRREVIAFIHAICSEQNHVPIAEIREIVNAESYND